MRPLTYLFTHGLPEAPGMRELLAIKSVEFCSHEFTVDDGY